MAYIGKEPQVGNYVKLDAISTSSTNTYNLTKDSVAFTPESALHMIVSLNGVIQAPLTSFSVSGSTITFLPSSGTLSSSDTIDFILVLGNVLDIGTPSDSTVTNAKTNFVSTSSSAGLTIKGDGTSSGTTGTLQLNCSNNNHGIKLASPAHTHGQSYTLTFPTTAPVADKALITDGSGNLSFGNAGGLVLLQTVTASDDATVEIGSSSLFTTTYRTYIIYYSNVHLAADNGDINLRFGISGSIRSDSYYDFTRYVRYDGSTSSVGQAGNLQNALLKAVGQARGNDTGEQSSGYVMVYDPASTDNYKHINIFNTGDDITSDATQSVLGGRYRTVSALTSIQFYSGAGNITSGYFRLYGIA